MARFADVNNTFTTNGAAWYRFKEVLKLAGWTIPSSSDGATYNASGDQITHGGTGAGGMQNVGAWFVARDPSGRRELCLQVSSAVNQHLRCKMSELARFVGGSPSNVRVPSATDEQVLFGGGTDAAPTYGTFWAVFGTHRLHCTAESSPVGGVYGFTLETTQTASANQINGQFFCEPMAPGSYRPSDASPCVWYCSLSGYVGSNLQGWFAFGLAGQAWSTAISANVGPYNGALGVNLVDGADDNGYPTYTATVSAATRIKGVGSAIAAKGPPRVYPATANTTGDARVYMGSFCYPYPSNTVPSVS